MNTYRIQILTTMLLLLSTVALPAEVQLTPTQMVEQALARNPDLETLSARVAQREAEADTAQAERMPSLGLSASSLHFKDPLRVRPATDNGQSGIFSQDLWTVGLSARWQVYSGGRISATAEAKRLLAESADADRAFFRERLATAVVSLAYEMAAQNGLLAARRKSLDSLREQEARIGLLLEKGKAAEVDRMRVRVRAASVEQDLIDARNQLAVLRSNLNLLMSRPLQEDWALVDPVALLAAADAIKPDPPLVPAQDRSDLKAAERRIAAAERTVRAETAAWQPQVELLANWGPRGDWQGEERYESGFVGVGLSLNLWDGNRRSSRIRASREAGRAAQSEARSLGESRKFEIVTARLDRQSATERLAVARIALDTANESLRIERRKYEQGRGVIIDVLDAEAATLETESLFRRAQADLLISQARIDLALGAVFTSAAVTPGLHGQ